MDHGCGCGFCLCNSLSLAYAQESRHVTLEWEPWLLYDKTRNTALNSYMTHISLVVRLLYIIKIQNYSMTRNEFTFFIEG